MFKIVLFCSLIAFIFGSAIDSTNNKIIKNAEENDLSIPILEQILENPSIKFMGSKKVNGTTRNIVRYAFGNRVIGDALVATNKGGEAWGSPNTVTLPIKWSGNWDQEVTYVEIQVDQSSGFGNATISNGNIGQRNISIKVEARFTTYFFYEYQIFAI